MSNVLEKVHYIKADVDENNNKFWYATLYNNGDVLLEWGRVGTSGQSKLKHGAGRGFFRSKISEKEGKGYEPIDIVDGTSNATVQVVENNRLKDIAKKQIRHSNPLVANLIDFLTKANAHNITTATGGQISFDYDSGLFRTPLGLVSQDTIRKARNLLVQLSGAVSLGGDLRHLTNQYMMLIPQAIGMRRLDVNWFWSGNQLNKQSAILDSLQSSLVSIPTVTVKDDEPEEEIFDVQLELVEDGKIIDNITKLFRKSINASHACAHLRVKKVYTVKVSSMEEAFAKHGAKLKNIWELWHGTRTGNLLSILKAGLIIPPSGAAHCTGRAYGDGVYASDQSTKALNYSHGYWGGGGYENHCFMFLLDMAMGKYFRAENRCSGFPVQGYDSTFAEGGRRFLNNEMIVYRTSQVNLKYLVEFE